MSGEVVELIRGNSDIPEGWREVVLSDCLADFRNGWTYDTRALDGTMPITRIETISNGVIDYGRIGFAQLDDRIEAFKLDRNDILFSHINSVEHIAKVAIKVDDRPLYHGMNLMRLRPNERVVPEFLFARLQSEQTRDHFRSVCKRAVNQASLNKGEIGSYEFILPPLDEQRRIAEVLRSVDEAIAYAESVAAQAKMTFGAVLADYFCSEKTENLASLSDLVSLQSGFAFKSQQYQDEGHFLIRIGNVQDGQVSLENPKFVKLDTKTQPFELHEGDILTSLTGNIGRVARLAGDHLPAALNQRVARIKPKPDAPVDADYLYFALQSPLFKDSLAEESGGAAQQNVSPKAIARVEIPLPSIAEQRRIGEFLLSVEVAISQAEHSLAKLRDTKVIIVSDLLSGRVRVPT